MAVERPPGEILKSNVDTTEAPSAAAPRRRRFGLFVPLLLVAIAAVVGVAVVFIGFPAEPARRPLAQAQPTASPFAPAAAKPVAAPGPLPAVRGISCDALESTLFHIHVHLAIFVNSQEQQVPYGDGVVHIESPIRRTFTLGDFFAIWQQPLSGSQVGPAQGAVIAYLNGARVTTNPSDIPLTSHALIQLDVGADVPPYPFDFSPRE